MAASAGSSGAAYSDRESPVEVTREGMSYQEGAPSRGLRDEGIENVRDEDVSNAT